MRAKDFNTHLVVLAQMNRAELQLIVTEATTLLPGAPEPSPSEAMLPPGHYLREKMIRDDQGIRYFVREEWRERDSKTGRYIRRSRAVFRGRKAEYLAKLTEIKT